MPGLATAHPAFLIRNYVASLSGTIQRDPTYDRGLLWG